MGNVQLVRLTDDRDHGFLRLIAQYDPVNTDHLGLCTNDRSDPPVITEPAKGLTLGYLRTGVLCGVVSFTAGDLKGKKRSTGEISSLYVWSKGHRYIIGERMLMTLLRIISEEFPKITEVKLSVVSYNEPAKRLYSRFGFRHQVTLEKAIRIAGEYRDKDLMMLELDKKY